MATKASVLEPRTRQIFVAVLLASMISANYPGLGNETSDQPSGSTCSNPGKDKPASPEDILIVQLTDKADRSQFDDLLKEVHGKIINTLDFGPQLQLLVVQAEPGKADELAKRLSKEKDIARVQRNQTYRANQGSMVPGR